MRDRYMLDERQARGAELLADVIIGVEDLVENPEALVGWRWAHGSFDGYAWTC
jgi:hypothetical protein